MFSAYPKLTPAWIVDTDVDLREVPDPIFVPRRYRVEETTTTTYADGRQECRSDFHYENRTSVFWSTRHVAVKVAIAECEAGNRFRFEIDDIRMREGEPVLIVQHSIIGFRPVEIFRIEGSRWLIESTLPEVGRVPSVLAALATVGAIGAEKGIVTIAGIAGLTFAASWSVLACIRLGRRWMLNRSRSSAIRAIPTLRV